MKVVQCDKCNKVIKKYSQVKIKVTCVNEGRRSWKYNLCPECVGVYADTIPTGMLGHIVFDGITDLWYDN